MINTKFNWLIILIILAFTSLSFSLFKGSTLISFHQLFNTLSGHGTPLTDEIIFNSGILNTDARVNAGKISF